MLHPSICSYFRRACPSILMVMALVAPASARPVPEPHESVVAIADVHGDFDDFLTILRRTGLVNSQNHWIGGRSTLVQDGDLLDRGPKPREVMNLVIALEKEASSAGGRVISLLGNHEMMNLMGDLRYVTPANYASFSDANSEKRQKTAFDDFAKWKASHALLLAELPHPMEMTETEWMARHPLGFVEQREAFSPEGEYGKWLRGHAAVAEVDAVIFLHGGISPALANTKLDAMNKKILAEVKAFDDFKRYLQAEKLILPFFNMQEIDNVLQAEVVAERKSLVPADVARQAKILDFLKREDWFSVRADGPLWFRGYALWSEEEGAPLVSKILESYKAKHLVVGHTVQTGGRVRPRFENKVFLIDTGMLSSYYPGGRASALEICDGARFIAVYPDQQVVLLDPSESSPKNGAPPAEHTGAGATGAVGVLSPEQACSSTTAAPH